VGVGIDEPRDDDTAPHVDRPRPTAAPRLGLRVRPHGHESLPSERERPGEWMLRDGGEDPTADED